MPQEKSPNTDFPQTQVITEEKTSTQEPPQYRVLLVNDDFTPMDFVIWVLENIYHLSSEESFRIMLEVHHKGQGLCGIFPYDVARTKVYQTQEIARKEGHPLQCAMEPEGESSQGGSDDHRRS